MPVVAMRLSPDKRAFRKLTLRTALANHNFPWRQSMAQLRFRRTASLWLS